MPKCIHKINYNYQAKYSNQKAKIALDCLFILYLKQDDHLKGPEKKFKKEIIHAFTHRQQAHIDADFIFTFILIRDDLQTAVS